MDVRYFPNPSNGNFTLMLSSSVAETASVKISSMNNKLVYSLDDINVLGVRLINISVPTLARGTYLLQVNSSGGELKDKLVFY